MEKKNNTFKPDKIVSSVENLSKNFGCDFNIRLEGKLDKDTGEFNYSANINITLGR